MKNIKLTAEETRETGFTHAWDIDYDDGDFSEAGVAQTYTLMTLPVGTIVKNVGHRIITNLDGGATATGTLALGVTGTVAGFATAKSVHADATPIDYGTGDGSLMASSGGHPINTAIAFLATLTTTVANVSVLTQGKVRIYASLANMAKV